MCLSVNGRACSYLQQPVLFTVGSGNAVHVVNLVLCFVPSVELQRRGRVKIGVCFIEVGFHYIHLGSKLTGHICC